MRKLIVNADDFGRSAAINRGVIEAHERGVVTSASLMVLGAAFDEAVKLAKQHPRLGVGLHLDLDEFFEVQHGVGRLVHYKNPHVSIRAILESAADQIRRFRSTGLLLDHLDGHHHCYLRPELLEPLGALAAQHGINVIRFFRGFYGAYPNAPVEELAHIPAKYNLFTVDHFFDGWKDVSWEGSWREAELMTHPGYEEPWREAELTRCCDPTLPATLTQHGIHLSTFADWVRDLAEPIHD